MAKHRLVKKRQVKPMGYDRQKAVAYAHKWAFERNPAYTDFDPMGGDCTNFISQCLYAGSGVMNYTPVMGWFYISLQKRTPAWSGVMFLYNFLVSNKGAGPYGTELPLSHAVIGDVIQLSWDGVRYTHSLLVVQAGTPPALNNILITCHTTDSDNRPLSSYSQPFHRLIHIIDARS